MICLTKCPMKVPTGFLGSTFNAVKPGFADCSIRARKLEPEKSLCFVVYLCFTSSCDYSHTAAMVGGELPYLMSSKAFLRPYDAHCSYAADLRNPYWS